MAEGIPDGGEDLVRSEARSSLRHLGRLLQIAAVLALVAYALSGIRTIKPNEIGVQLRFGAAVRADLKPGMHYTLPWPIGSIDRVPVKTVERIVVDDLSASLSTDTASGDHYKRTGLKSYALTGDNNLVHLSFTVQYVVADPVEYLYRSQGHRELLRHLASSAALHAVAGMSVEDVLTGGKATIAEAIRRRLASELDLMGSGLAVASVELADVSPPPKVQKSFDDVVNAQQDARTSVSEAESYRNSQLPKAQGEASKQLSEARGYRQKQVAHAEGEADRFLATLTEYSKARRVSRQRLYLDFVNRVYPELHSKIVVQERNGQPVGDVRLQGDGKQK